MRPRPINFTSASGFVAVAAVCDSGPRLGRIAATAVHKLPSTTYRYIVVLLRRPPRGFDALKHRIVEGKCLTRLPPQSVSASLGDGWPLYIVFQSPTFSKASATCNTMSSSKCLPTSIMPMGRLSSMPQGTLIAGCPVTLAWQVLATLFQA